jgi:hypothetical protein
MGWFIPETTCYLQEFESKLIGDIKTSSETLRSLVDVLLNEKIQNKLMIF